MKCGNGCIRKKLGWGFACLVVLYLVLWGKDAVFAATDIREVSIEPCVMTEGTQAEIDGISAYEFTSDGQTLVPVIIRQDGFLVMDVQIEIPGIIIVERFQEPGGNTLPDSFPCRCTVEQRKTGVLKMYLKKGTYYFRFPENTYRVRARAYVNNGKKMKDSDTLAGYCNHLQTSLFSYKATKTGYLAVSVAHLEQTTSSLVTVLCDAKGNELTDTQVRNILNPQDEIYVVKKGVTYYLKVYSLDVNGENCYRIKTKFAAKTDAGGASKKKATSIKFGEKSSGLVFAEDKDKTADWFKISVSKKQRVKFRYSSLLSSGSLLIDIYDEKGKLLVKEYAVETQDKGGSFEVLNANGTTKLPKGVYYIKVTKASKKTSGYYTIGFSKYAE